MSDEKKNCALPLVTGHSSLSYGCGFLPLAATEIIEFRTTGAAWLFHFHFRDARRMQRKHPLHALTVRDATHGESFVEAAALPADHYAGKDLDSFLIAFYDPRVHAHAVANRKRCNIAFLLLFLNSIDDLVHKLVASRAASGAHSQSEAQVLQPEITKHSSTSTKHENEHQNAQKLSVKICGICG